MLFHQPWRMHRFIAGRLGVEPIRMLWLTKSSKSALLTCIVKVTDNSDGWGHSCCWWRDRPADPDSNVRSISWLHCPDNCSPTQYHHWLWPCSSSGQWASCRVWYPGKSTQKCRYKCYFKYIDPVRHSNRQLCASLTTGRLTRKKLMEVIRYLSIQTHKHRETERKTKRHGEWPLLESWTAPCSPHT